MGGSPLWTGAAVAYGIVLIYVLVSGVSAVGWTNTLQGVFMIVIAWSLGIYLPNALYGGIGPMFEAIMSKRPDLLELPGLTAGGEPWQLGRLQQCNSDKRRGPDDVAAPVHESIYGTR